MAFCTITPDRGDRPQLLEFCKHQLSRMNTKPDRSYFVDYQPLGATVDLVARIREGVRRAILDGFDQVMIIENDDWYDKSYFDDVPDIQFIGSNKTTYYHIGNRSYQDWTHPKHSSLFLTGFKISALQDFDWPEEKERFLDISLWQHALNTRKQVYWRDVKAIGIKHGIGLCGGKGHIQRNKYRDMDFEWLKANVDNEAYLFYQTLLK